MIDAHESATLLAQAQAFADNLTATVASVVPGCDQFRPLALGTESSERFAVHQSPATGIPLRVGGSPLLTLKVSFKCEWDSHNTFLAVDESVFAVYPGASAAGEPLFRYDYQRSPTSKDVPGAHLQVHAHRDAVTYAMARAGRGTKRGRKRSQSTLEETPRLSELHFPLGGSRFRPCLEDLLEMLISEFGIDNNEGALEALRDSREQWRRRQLRVAVRDAPQDAAATLRALGYEVTAPTPVPVDNMMRLRRP